MFQKRHLGRTKILEHKHTGKLQPHHHTSYGGLLLVLVLACCCVLLTQHTVSADDTGGVQTFAVVPAPIYKNGPTMSNVQNGQLFRTTDPAVVSGSCPGRSLVEIFKNDVMAGAVLCNGGSYQLSISLFNGSNTLITRAYNPNGIPSPDSAPVTVRLIAVGNLFGNAGLPFYVSADQKYEAAKTGDQLSWLLTLSGGQAPYAVSVNWGDGKSDLFSRTTAGSYNLSHAYQYAASAGNYGAH